jgi:hypothetical protein
MQEQPEAERNDADRLRTVCLSAIRDYADASDPETRSRILEQALTDLAAQDTSLARARLREWVIGPTPAGMTERANYARFQELLPLVLAGAPGMSYADIAWFMHYLGESDAYLDEYMEVRHALDAEHAALEALYNPPPGEP